MPVESLAALEDGDLAAVLALLSAAEQRDGAPPLSDQALTHLGSASVAHFLARGDGGVTGYAQLDGPSLEIAAAPAAVPGLLAAAEASATDGLRVWSHGRHSVLAPVLGERGYRRIRVLHQLRRPTSAPVPEAPVPDGVTLRAFRVGADEDAWLAVNAAAFASHAEQGRWTIADLAAREAEPWFDPDGFLLAWRGADLLGYHWTKLHDDGLGEVYVLGVAPAAQGIRLGPALLSAGLRYLAERGAPGVLLYVDDDNPGALRLYARYGFTEHDTDVQWAAPPR